MRSRSPPRASMAVPSYVLSSSNFIQPLYATLVETPIHASTRLSDRTCDSPLLFQSPHTASPALSLPLSYSFKGPRSQNVCPLQMRMRVSRMSSGSPSHATLPSFLFNVYQFGARGDPEKQRGKYNGLYFDTASCLHSFHTVLYSKESRRTSAFNPIMLARSAFPI